MDISIYLIAADFNRSGKKYFMEGDNDRGEFNFLRSNEINENAESTFYLGLIASQRKENERALKHFHKSVDLNPNYGNPCNEIGVLLLRKKKYKEAIFWLKRSIRAKYNDARHIPLYNLAALYKIWNRPERSLQYLTRAIDLQPDFNEAIRMRNQLLS